MPTIAAEPVRVAAGVICRDNRILIAKRPDHLHKGGLWEFPGGKIEINELAEDALARELTEELDVKVELSSTKHLLQIDWAYTEKKIQLEVFLVPAFSGEPKGFEGQQIEWVLSSEIDDYDFPEANAKIVSWVKSNL